MGPTVSQARNIGALHVGADWLIFLDADDELDPRYVEEMLAGEGDIRQPSTLGVINGVEDDYPVLIPPGPNFMAKNHLIIGCMVRRDLFIAAGGFRDLPVLEDWDLWIRLRLAGATVGQCPKAVYRVHVRPNSRNQDVGLHARVFQQIQDEHSAAWFVRGLK
jgi:GT2 family glycosyltransferase